MTNVRNTLINICKTFENKNENINSQKKIAILLQGIQNQIDKFIKIIQEQWQQNSLDKITSKITECQQSLPPSEEYINLHLQILTKNYQEFKENYETISKNNNINEKKSALEELLKKVKEYEKAENLFEKAAIQINQAKRIIETLNSTSTINGDTLIDIRKNITQRIKNLVPEDIISQRLSSKIKNSNFFDGKSSKQFQIDFKKTLRDYRQLNDDIEISLFEIESNLKIDKLVGKLPWFYFNTIVEDLEKLSAIKLDERFNPHFNENGKGNGHRRQDAFLKQDFSDYFQNIKDYAKHLESYDEKKQALENLNQTFSVLKSEFEHILTNISESIQTIEKRKEKTFNVLDKGILKKLLEQNTLSISELKKLEKSIKEKWNDFCLRLYTTNRQYDFFIKVKNITEKLSWYYFSLVETYQDLRNLRWTENEREDVEKIFQLNYQRCSQLCASISAPAYIFDVSYDIDSNPQEILDPNQINKFNSLNEEINTTLQILNLSLRETINKFKNIIDNNLNLENLHQPQINLIDVENSEIEEEFLKQENIFNQKWLQHEKDINEIYTTKLPKVFKLANKKITKICETLKGASSEYDHSFTGAYWADNTVGYAGQVVGEGIKTVTNSAVVYINSKIYGDNQEQPQVRSNFNYADFPPLESPFETKNEI